MQGTFPDRARIDAKTASNFLVAAAAIHVLAIPVGLLLFKFLVERTAGRSVSWGEIFAALQQLGYLGVIVGGILAQAIFASIAGIGAFLLRAGRPQVAIPMIVVGVAAVVFSFASSAGSSGRLAGSSPSPEAGKGRGKPPPLGP